MTDPRTTRVRRRIVAGTAALGAAVMLGAAVPVPAGAATAPTPRRIVTGWGYFNTPSASALASLQANADLFTDISPFWHSAKWSGGVSSISSPYSATTRASVLPAIRAAGVAVLPSITDGMGAHRMAAVLAGTGTRAAFVNQIVATVVAEGYNGIDLDFEGFAFADGRSTWAATRPNWVAFVKALSAGLHARGKLLSVTTPPLYTATTGYWVYDWKSIGGYVDRLRVMTYDYSTSSAGPISPFPWVEKVAAFAVTQVASGKVQIGVPDYGRDWVTSVTYGGVTGLCPTNAPTGANPTQVTAFADAFSYATARQTFTSSGAGSYVAQWSGPRFATLGVRVVTRPVVTWHPTYKERTFTSKVSFTGTRAQRVVATGTAALASTTVTVSSTAGLVVGLTVAGAGIAAGTTVQAFDPTTKIVTLTAPTTSAIAAGALTFSGAAPATCTVTRLAYYDDATAAAARAALVGTYHLRGIAQWTIGGEDPSQWSKLRTYATSIAPSTTRVTVSGPAVAPYRSVVTWRGVATSDGVAVPAAPASLWYLRPGGTAWTRLAVSTTDAAGRVAFQARANGRGTYMIAVTGTFDRLGGNGKKAFGISSAVVVSATTAKVRASSAVRVTAYLVPAHRGQASLLQRRTSKGWVTLGATKADALGRVAYVVRAPASGGRYDFRLLAAAYPNVAARWGFFSVQSA